jgi:hypothetical protein
LSILLYLLVGVLALIEEFPSLDSIDADRVITIYSSIPGYYLSVFEIILAFVSLGIVLSAKRRDCLWRLVRSCDWKIRALFVFFLVGIVVGFSRGASIKDVIFQVRAIVDASVFFCILIAVVDSLAEVERLLKLLVILGCLKGYWGLYLLANGIGRELEGSHIVYYDFGSLLVFLIASSFLIPSIISAFSIRKLVAGALIITPMAVSFVYSYRRGLYVGLLVGAIVFVSILMAPARLRMLFRMLIATLMIVTLVVSLTATQGVVGLIQDQIGQNIASSVAEQSMSDVESSNLFRLLETNFVLDELSASPILGRGWGTRYAIDNRLPPMVYFFFNEVNMFVHDSHLMVALKMGLVGFFFYLLCIWDAFRNVVHAFNARHNARTRNVLGVIVFISMVYFTMFFFGPQIAHIRTMCIIALTTGLGYVMLAQIGPSTWKKMIPRNTILICD